MRRHRIGMSVAAVLVVATVATVWTCGDKYLVPGRGVQFQPTPAERQKAAVLMYAPADSSLGRTLARLGAEPALRKVGYRPTVAATRADLTRAASTSWDVVLVGGEEAAAVSNDMTAANKSHIVVVLLQPTAAQVTAARSAFAMVVRAPSKNQDFLDALDEAAGRAFAGHARTPSVR